MRGFSVVAVSVAVFGCSNPGSDPPPKATSEPPAIVSRESLPRDPAPGPAIDLRIAPGLELRRPIKDGRLTLIPIVVTTDMTARRYITLQDGLRGDVVSAREISGDDVDFDVGHVRVTNRSEDPLAIIEGQLLVDGDQDRVTAENTVIPPGTAQDIAVRCVEHERSSGDGEFHAGNAIAELGLRRTLVYSTQEDVWRNVDAINARENLRPPTKTYRLAAHAQTDDAARARRDSLIRQLEKREERTRIVGLAVAIDGAVVAVDQLATPELYRALEAELIASYLPDTSGAAPARVEATLAPDDVRAILARTPGSSSAAARIVIRNP